MNEGRIENEGESKTVEMVNYEMIRNGEMVIREDGKKDKGGDGKMIRVMGKTKRI